MSTTLKAAVEDYLRAKTLSRGTRNEYHATVRKWEQWGGPPLESLQHKEIRAFLDWVHERAVIEALPLFPRPREQRDVAGRHYLTKAEINALYFATHQMKRPRGWDSPFPVGRYWRGGPVGF